MHHWYVLSETTGIATLCASEQDARSEARDYDKVYPLAAPHVATRLQPIDTGLLAAAQQTLAENAHLADGDTCTLLTLKRAVAEVAANAAKKALRNNTQANPSGEIEY
jgi:hypothetical protein